MTNFKFCTKITLYSIKDQTVTLLSLWGLLPYCTKPHIKFTRLFFVIPLYMKEMYYNFVLNSQLCFTISVILSILGRLARSISAKYLWYKEP